MPDLKRMINHLGSCGTLSLSEKSIMSGVASHAQIGAVLMALRMRGDTVNQIAGEVLVMHAHMVRVSASARTIDILGTGGDNAGTYNVSTYVAFSVAGAGFSLAKQGNRAFSSRSGIADVL